MAFRGASSDNVDFDSLLVTLNNSGIQTKNNALYQTIEQLIKRLKRQTDIINQRFNTVIGEVNIDNPFSLVNIVNTINNLIQNLQDASFITAEDETLFFLSSLQVSDIILRDTRANQPAATSVPVGTLYYVTDEETTERSNGTIWETYADAGGSSSGDGQAQLHGLMRLLGDGATTTFNLFDYAEYLEHIAIDGAIVDPFTFSLSSDRGQIVFDAAPGNGLVIAIEYVVAQI